MILLLMKWVTAMTDMSNEYGTALFMLAKENSAEQEYADALEKVSGIFNENPEYIDFLASPSIPVKERTAAIEQAFAGALPEYVINFLQLLCEKGYIKSFESCVSEYNKLFGVLRHIVTAHVSSAVELTENEKENLRCKLEKISGASVILECCVDKSLIGGIVVEMEGMVMDGSLRRRLHEVKDVISK